MAIKKVEYISPSQISRFRFCPLAYKFIYIDGAQKEPPNIYMIYGSALHEALAFNYRQKITSRKDLSDKEVYKFFSEEFYKECQKIGVGIYNSQYTDMLSNTKLVLENYMKTIAPGIQPLLVEHKFELQLKKYPIKIMGIFDLVTEDYWIDDHKTSGRAYKKDWNQARIDSDIQFTIYAAAFRKMFGIREAGIRVDVIPRNPSDAPLIMKSYRTDQDVIDTLEMASKIEQIVALGLFLPNTSNCSRCPFEPSCKKQPVMLDGQNKEVQIPKSLF